ncbi:MAG TPA: hypothetical protein VGT41_06230 [Candidatus Babeliales bacterium]|nr:hypothetical protein [Candidatus Babeliales bacterium]
MKFKYLLLIVCSSGTIFAANPASDLAKALSSKGSRASNNTQKTKVVLRNLQREALQTEVQHWCAFNPAAGKVSEGKLRNMHKVQSGPNGAEAARSRLQLKLMLKQLGERNIEEQKS